MNKVINKMKGVTLIEVLAVVIIGVLIIVGAFTLYGKAQTKQGEKDLLTAINAIQLNIKDNFIDNEFSSLDNNLALTLNAVPPSITSDSDGELTHMLGGTLEISGTQAGFEITVNGLQQESCISLSQRRDIADAIKLDDVINPSARQSSNSCDLDSPSFIFSNNVNRYLASSVQSLPR